MIFPFFIQLEKFGALQHIPLFALTKFQFSFDYYEISPE